MEKEKEVTEETPKEETPVEEVKEEEVKEEVVEEEKTEEFNADEFADTPVATEEVEEEKKEEEEVVEEEVVDDGIEWAGYDEEEEVVDEEKKEAEVVSEEAKEVESNKEPQSVSSEVFKSVATELGLREFESIDEFKEHLQMLEEENNKLRTSSGSGATNEAIKKLQDLKDKKNEELVKLSLEKDGFSGDELQDAVDKYIDNGMLDIEAKKIRNTIDNAIVSEQNKETQSTVEADAKQQQEHEESVKALEEHLSKTETMFGFAMAKDKDSLGKVQKGHLNYITSGKFMNDVFESEASVSEVAWFVKNKKTIINAISNKSLQQGKKAILDNIHEPEVVRTQRYKDPKSDSFDPKLFTHG